MAASQSDVLKRMEDFSNRFQDILIDMQKVLIDAELRSDDWEESAKAKYAETQKYSEEVDSIITEIFSKCDLTTPGLMEKATQFLVSYKPQIDSFRNQIQEAIKTPPPQFKLHDSFEDELDVEETIKEIEENQKKAQQQQANEFLQQNEEKEEKTQITSSNEEEQTKLAAEILKKTFEDETEEEKKEIKEEEESEDEPVDPLREYMKQINL